MATAFGWDESQTRATSVLAGEDAANQTDQLKKYCDKFIEFIRTFRIDNEFLYRDMIRGSIMAKKYFIEVDLAHLMSYDEGLANDLKERPGDLLHQFELAVESVAKQNTLSSTTTTSDEMSNQWQVMVLSNANPVPIRDLDSTYISHLVRLSGIIISASMLSAKPTEIHLRCKSCRDVQIVAPKRGMEGIEMPRSCLAGRNQETGSKNCGPNPYELDMDKSKFVDSQRLKLQEAPDMVPVGELPRHMLLYCDRWLTEKVIPGTRVTVTGIFAIYDNSGKSKGPVAIQHSYIRVVGMQTDVEASGRSNRTFTPSEEEIYLAMSRRPNIYEEFASSIAPPIYGNEDIKKAIACLLLGGSKKILPDGMRLRGDINVLLLGDPGTAKSQLLKFVEKVAPIGVYTSGKGSSAAGLTASVVRDPSTREFYLEGGAMVLADGGVVCIDEFDKMREEDRVAIHEAMEQQTISIAKAGITTILNSRTSVLAAANPVFGRYDDMKTPGENIDFQSTILSRFDLIFIVKDEWNEARDRTIAKHVLNVHMNNRTAQSEAAVGEFDMQRMRGYISYCKTKCAPRLTPEAAAKLSSHFVEVRGKVAQMEKDNQRKSAIPITVRQLEAIVRVSESVAKIALSPVVTERHVDEGIRLFNVSTMSAVDSGRVEGLSRAEYNEEVGRIRDQINRRLPVGSQVSERALKDDLIRQGFTNAAVDRSIGMMVGREILQYKQRRMVLFRAGL
ncbi:hypothetical protein SmJEL517_g03728 [Synchytrium microbalum]|uniref:DNA replication licensing factor MCM5 n=1 Tax=Synchytrium microbalum TaxID=1806994 RepID=A0A507C7A1_9FUNG|nr:uncharacterized protein SmJEL517_g03728 [Synchytrium microbalum]TPX33365.1 hypothetical protein SmJEL517_g03728 [Synchytrium microbalum]